MEARRVKILRMDANLLIDVLTWWRDPPHFLALPITEELPEDCEVLHIWPAPAYAAFETKVQEARAETNRGKQGKLWQELNQYVLDQVWAIPGSFTKAQDIWGSKVGNTYRWGPFGSFNFGDLFVNS